MIRFPLIAPLLLSLPLLTTVSPAQAGGGAAKGAQAQLTPEQKARQDSADLQDRARKAQERALFSSTVPLPFTLIANYGAISKDRDTLSTRRFAGTLLVADSAGVERRIPVELRTRGHFRLLARNCRFVPLRVYFPDSGLKGTPFAGQKGLKLGTHCQSDGRYEEYTRKEYLAYRLHNVLTDQSFRARLARGTYVDSASGKTLETRTALFLESEDDVARRLGSKVREMRGALFDDVDRDALLQMTVFEYMIGNTDWSLYALHNVRLAMDEKGMSWPLAYDFDHAGLVNAHYATVDPRIGVKTVRDRRFRGPCRSQEEVGALAAKILAKRDAFLAEIPAVEGLSRRSQEETREYLQDFFRTLSNPNALRQELIENCERRPGA